MKSKDKHGTRRSRSSSIASIIDNTTDHHQTNSRQQTIQMKTAVPAPPNASTSFRLIVAKPQVIVIDLLGVLVCKSFMTSSREFREFFVNNIQDYLTDNWRQKQLKIMINFFRCSQATVPEEYKLADREESRDDQIRAARKHIVWKLRNDPTNSALSLFMLGITEWGYKNKTLTTTIYDDVVSSLKFWKDQKILCYVGVGSADFLLMVLTNTNHGNIVPFFNGHMNIMDFDGTKANKDFKKLVAILRVSPDKILYLTRFRQDYKKAIENGIQSLIVLRPDFDSHGLIPAMKAKRAGGQSVDARQGKLGPADDTVSPPGRQLTADIKNNPEIKDQVQRNMSSLSLIEDFDDGNPQSSQIVENDLFRFNIILSLTEIGFK